MLQHYSCTFLRAWWAVETLEKGTKKGLGVGGACDGCCCHFFQTGNSDGGEEAQVQVTGAAMERKVDVEGSNGMALLQLACCAIRSVLALKAK